MSDEKASFRIEIIYKGQVHEITGTCEDVDLMWDTQMVEKPWLSDPEDPKPLSRFVERMPGQTSLTLKFDKKLETTVSTRPADKPKTLAERSPYFSDLFFTACEGGVNYWAAVCKYDVDALTATLVRFDEVPDGILQKMYLNSAQLVADVAAKLDEIPAEFKHDVNPDTIGRGILALDAPVKGLNDERRERLRAECYAEEPDFDGDDADVIMQIGIFGEVVYG
ncbi:hypothetical protein [Microbispora sp. NPDC049633]|uniref:hypothetical protein n=1 Tax=Microbispora sp. NPDC049633 TaxID=3154355 RepID=UPI003441B722